jgi:hypothetical protein
VSECTAERQGGGTFGPHALSYLPPFGRRLVAMKLWSRKNRRLSALVLLAAFALLQVRVAFAACEMERVPQQAVDAVAACCLEHGSTMDVQPADQMGPGCVSATCAEKLDAPQADPRALLNVQVPSLAQAPPASAGVWLTSDGFLPFPGAAQGHPPHIPLIYVLQRLLI